MHLIPDNSLEQPITSDLDYELRTKMQELINHGARFYILRSDTKIPDGKWGGKKKNIPGITSSDLIMCYDVGQATCLVPSSVNAVVLDNDYLEGEELIEFETQVEDDILINVPSQTTPRAHVWFPCKHDVKEGGWQYKCTTAGEIKSYGIVAIKTLARLYNVVNVLHDYLHGSKSKTSLPKDYFDQFRKRGVRFSEPIEPARRRLACTTVEIEQHIEHYKTGDNPAYQTDDGKWTNFPCIYQHDRKHIHSKDTRGAYYNPADGYHGCTAHEAHSGYARDAEVELRGGARDGAGRPVGITDTHERERETYIPPEERDCTKDIPLRLQATRSEYTDIERIVHYRKDRIIRIRTNLELTYGFLEIGLWREMPTRFSGIVGGEIMDNLLPARKSALTELKEFLKKHIDGDEYSQEEYDLDIAMFKSLPYSHSHRQKVARHLKEIVVGTTGASMLRTVRREEIDNFHKHSVIPFEQGGAISLRSGDTIDDTELATYLLTGAWGTLPDGFNYVELLKSDSATLQGLKELFSDNGRFAGALTLFARYFHGIGKDIDVLRAQQANYGKSTLINLFRSAFPGMVKELDGSTVFGRKETRFNPFTDAMSSSIAVLVDEADKVENMSAPLFLKMTAKTMDVERKGENEVSKPRTGTMVLVGAGWPDLDTTHQGVKERIGVALDFKGHGTFSVDEFNRFQSEESLNFFRAMVIQEAITLYQEAREANEDVLEFAKRKIAHLNRKSLLLEERDDELVVWLRNRLKDSAGRISNKDLAILLDDGHKVTGEEIPKGKAVRGFLERCFTGVRKYRTGKDRGWTFDRVSVPSQEVSNVIQIHGERLQPTTEHTETVPSVVDHDYTDFEDLDDEENPF